MKDRTFYSLLILVFVVVIGLMFVQVPLTSGPSDSIASASISPTAKNIAFSAPLPDVASAALPPSLPPSPLQNSSPQPENTTAYQSQLPPPGSGVLTIPGAVGETEVPAAFVVKANDPNLNADQVERINAITKNFTQEMSAGNANPDDPAYLTHWQKAQADANDQLRLVLSQEDYLKYSLAATRESSN